MEKETVSLKRSKKLLILFVLLLYAVIILYLKFLRPGAYGLEDPAYNWIPFMDVYNFHGITSLLYNVAAFIPYGILIGLVKKNEIWFFIGGLVAGFLIELLQVVFKTGVFDMTSVVANLIGMAAGYFVYRLIADMFTKNKTEKKAA